MLQAVPLHGQFALAFPPTCRHSIAQGPMMPQLSSVRCVGVDATFVAVMLPSDTMERVPDKEVKVLPYV
jgi:hypothetical protein